ncbi:type IV secretion system DNA-binding domain-containing protein [Pseudomonas sp. NC26]|uniref:helicase HerA domain-containing protein n=1 Tax=Pseudomonas sp. NC26 TaxID=3114535 RepID=UPI002DEC9D1D|nr:type IV secretion system DNA-binding domain-containing protein [Pseudomonas sp. NC26]
MYQAAPSQPTALSQAIAGLTHYDPIRIGSDSRGQTVDWVLAKSSNFNVLFEGASGAGKSHTIQNLLARVYSRGMTFHVLDIKGDFSYESFEKAGLSHLVRPEDFNDITFNYFEGGSSLNPLQVPRTKEGGGVLMTVEGMKQLVKVFAPNTGKRQLDYLEEILNEVYRKAGISQDDIESWIRPSPTLDQVLDEIDLVFNSISASMDSGSVSDIMRAYGQAKSKAEKTIVKMKADGKDPLQIEDKVNEILDDLEGVLHGYAKKHLDFQALQNKSTGNGTFWEFWSKDSLFGLRSIIQGMVKSRLFTGNPSKSQAGKINRYVLTDISSEHQQIIMRIVASRVFAMGVMDTRRSGLFNPEYPSHILIADEGKHVKQISSSPLSPVNRIATEGRGYGVGVWAGVQQPDQVTPDLLKNVSTYFLLKTPETTYGEVSRMFGVKPSLLKQLQNRQNVLFSAGDAFTLVTHFKE